MGEAYCCGWPIRAGRDRRGSGVLHIGIAHLSTGSVLNITDGPMQFGGTHLVRLPASGR